MEKDRISNYEKTKNKMAKAFLQYDQEEMIRKFSLEQDEAYLYILFTGKKYRINRFTGAVSWSEDFFRTEENADYNEAMTIYDVLCYSKKDCHLAGEWVNIDSLSAVRHGSLQKGTIYSPGDAAFFDGKTESLARACEALRGKKLEKGDVAYEIELFPFLPIVLRFWSADEDFPAALQVLTDKNILAYMHYETLMLAVAHMFGRIKEEMRREP